MITPIRIAGYSEGSDLSGEPLNWLLIDPDTGARVGVEWNPNYVPPAPPTEREQLEQEIAYLESELVATKRAILSSLES